MDVISYVIGFTKGKQSGKGFFSRKKNSAGGMTYSFKATENLLQEKSVTVTENGTTEIVPDDGYDLSKVTVTVSLPTYTGEYEEVE